MTPSLIGFGLSASSVVFGAAAPTITAPTSASAGAITYTSSNLDTAFMNNSYTGVMTLTGVGTAVITATQAANSNYTSTTTSITLTVTAANPLDGALVSGGLTFTRNNSTVPRGGMSNWTGANSTCSTLTTPGLPAGSWRLPLAIELLMLQSAGIQQLITAGWGLNRTWTSEEKDSSNHIFLSLDFGTVGWDLDNKGYYVSCVH